MSSLQQIGRKFTILMTSGFYTGYAPVASGTFGTLVGILFYLPIRSLSNEIYAAVVAAFTMFAIFLSHKAESIYGEKDSGKIVIDEIAGYLVTMFALPAVFNLWVGIAVGFFVFRFFDIAKPFPAQWIDRKLKGGAGVVLDDVFAGFYALGTMHLIAFLWTKAHS